MLFCVKNNILSIFGDEIQTWFKRAFRLFPSNAFLPVTGIHFSTRLKFSWKGLKFSWKGLKLSWKGLKLNWKGLKFSWKGLKFSWKGLKLNWKGLKFSWKGLKFSWKGLKFNHAQDSSEIWHNLFAYDELPSQVLFFNFNHFKKMLKQKAAVQVKMYELFSSSHLLKIYFLLGWLGNVCRYFFNRRSHSKTLQLHHLGTHIY
jgi:diacylglycerol kinase